MLKSGLVGSLLLFTLIATGCGQPDYPADHVYVAPHGGVLVPLDDRKYQVEVVLDRAEGEIQIFTLDQRAEKTVPTSNEGLELHVTLPGDKEPRILILDPAANAATGEIAGNTSRYRRQVDWLKTAEPVTVVFEKILIRGRKYQNASVTLTPAK